MSMTGVNSEDLPSAFIQALSQKSGAGRFVDSTVTITVAAISTTVDRTTDQAADNSTTGCAEHDTTGSGAGDCSTATTDGSTGNGTFFSIGARGKHEER